MAKKKASKKITSKKIAKKAPPRKKKGGRSPSNKGKQSKVHKILKWLKLKK